MIEAVSNASTNLQMAQLQQAAGTAVLDSSLEMAETQGSQMVGLIEQAGAVAGSAAQPVAAITDSMVGQNVDLTA